MKNNISLFLFLISLFTYSQTDYSNSWEDFFSYNNVKNVVVAGDVLYALTDNAVFTYDTETEEIHKISSVNGLSGRATSAISYSSLTGRLIIGYDNGLLEIINSDDTISIAPDIVNFNQTGLKSINDIYEYNDKLYLSTEFAVIVYDVENLEFGDTYFIGSQSSDVAVNQITVLGGEIYAATDSGIYVADVTATNLIDASNWDLRFSGSYQKIAQFNNVVYTVSGRTVSRINGTSITQVLSFSETVKDITVSENNFIVSLGSSALVYNSSLVQTGEVTITTEFDFTLNTAIVNDGNIVLATEEYGLLIGNIGSETYTEIHPEGPLSNDVFSIDTYNNNLWVVYGGYNSTYTPLGIRQGFSHYNGENWVNINYNSNIPTIDLVHVTIDEAADNRVFISSFGGSYDENSSLTGGLFEVENDEISSFYGAPPLERILVDADPTFITVRVSDTAFDDDGNLWVTNVGASLESNLKQLTSSGEWISYNINEVLPNALNGITGLRIDSRGTKWMATRGNGVVAFNENGDQKKALTTELNKGSLPNARVESLAVDANNNIWIGTISGLVVFYSTESIFETDTYDAEPVIILQDGVAERLLGDQNVRSIVVDGANNKWFGTDSGGVLNTNPDGQTTLANFNSDNSPLPSNRILKISIDDSTGKVFFVTDKGMVAYNSNVAPFGDGLPEVYAYPNPVLKNHDTVTIDGRKGTHLPENTNVKILDVAGNLVYETNVVEGEQLQGGKVVWNKRNLAGTKVASGIYIVFLATEDGSESITTKIAIIN